MVQPQSERRRYHHGSLRSALIEAAARLASEVGASAVTLRETARRAGVTQAAPYHYFRSKSALLAAVAEEGFRLLDDALGAGGSANMTAEGRLTGMLVAYLRFALERPHYFHVMFRARSAKSEAHPALMLAANRTIDRLVEAVRDARIAAGHDDLDPAAAAILIWSVPHGLSSLYLDGPLAYHAVTPVMIERLVRMALDPLLSAPLEDLEANWAV
jgi:AcrR family transcriptional regulator